MRLAAKHGFRKAVSLTKIADNPLLESPEHKLIHTHTHTRACTHTRARTPTHPHARTGAHAHRHTNTDSVPQTQVPAMKFQLQISRSAHKHASLRCLKAQHPAHRASKFAPGGQQFWIYKPPSGGLYATHIRNGLDIRTVSWNCIAMHFIQKP